MTSITHPAFRAQVARREAARSHASTSAYVLLFGVLAVLNLIGLVMVLSASSVVALHREGSAWFFFMRQLIGVGGGVVLFLVTVRIDYRKWRMLSVLAYAGVVALLAAVLVPGVGVNVNGSSRWVDLKLIQLQPSEFAKLAVLLVVAHLIARRQAWVEDVHRVLVPALLWFGLVALFLMAQPNLGTTLVLGAIVFSMLWAAGVPGRFLARVGFVGGSLALAATIMTPYRRARFFAFLDPWADAASTGYQNVQSQVSLGSGGWFGVGLGRGTQKWGYLPEAHTDFIFAIIGEELGLMGAFTIVGLFGALGYLGIRAAAHAPDTFGRLVATGITTWFCVQAFVNIGVVIGILPITGVPLPFISFGSSAMLANMAAAGVLCNVCRQSRR